jgi:Xaa-Pro dipeptidase
MESSGASHAIIFSGNPKYAFLDDMPYPFNANPHFLSWVPLTELPLSYIVYTPGDKPILIYYQPHDYWHVVPGEPDGFWVEQFDIRIASSTDDVAQHLPEARDKCILIGDIDDDVLVFGIDRINPSSAMNILHYARAI